ncbi:hypothetical protein V865_000130 [Kwoniella europaea PYCC6329]|uniref:C2H2-type domain-containing protein n=1 Tax=Kwoniella europaea PYCC6329 TaxID=1423913 RepID=A0AAX4K8W3_9TREE
MPTVTVLPISHDRNSGHGLLSPHLPSHLSDNLPTCRPPSPRLIPTRTLSAHLRPISPMKSLSDPVDSQTESSLNTTSSGDDSDSSDTTETLGQLVNDHNHVGAGHDAHARPHICTYADCNKAFARKSDLARHFRIHTNDRPFTCTYRGCGKSFIQRSALTVHYRVHTGERPHHCETCNKAFADSSSLASHRRIHTGMRPYTCKVPGCGKPFARRNTLLKHWKRQHPHLPPPSTNTHRNNIHTPVPNVRTSSASFPSSNGEYYPATPSSASAPHGYATLHPSEGTAYPFSGGLSGGPIFGGASGQSSYVIPGHPGGYRPPQFYQSPQAQGSVALTPISTTASHFGDSIHQGSNSQTPSTPAAGGFGGDNKHQIHSGPASAHPGLSPSPGINQQSFSQVQYPSSFNSYSQSTGYSLSRFPSEGGGMIYTDGRAFGNMSQRSVSNPLEAPKFQPYMAAGPYGHVGGGFHPSQLAMPHNQHPQLLPSYYHSMHMGLQPRSANEVKSEFPSSPNGSSSDDDDEPLVALSEAPPSIALHPPTGPAMNMPFSAVESSNFGQFPNAQPQVLAVQQSSSGRLHSAPPTLQRFNSLPTVPTVNQWGQVNGYQSHSVGDAKSADEEWEDIADEMLSREASVADDTQVTPATVEHKTPMNNVEEGNQWGEPIEYPVPPLETRKNPFSSAASSSSTSSTLVGSSIHTLPPSHLPPISVFTHANQPMALTPINPNGFYPTPITPANWSHDGFKPHAVFESPAMVNHQQRSDRDQENDHSQDITLTTPPKWIEQQRKDGRTVSAVGLGIANVHFDDRENDIVVEGKEDRDWDPTCEGEDEKISEDDTVDDDGSDDEFVLGSRPKKGRNSTARGRGRGRGSRGMGVRRGRK